MISLTIFIHSLSFFTTGVIHIINAMEIYYYCEINFTLYVNTWGIIF